MKRSGSGAAKSKNARASSLQAELARQIMEIARDEAWPLGTHVPQLALARRFGVSRSSVRGALEMLAEHDAMRLRPRDRAGGRLASQVSESELSTRYRATRSAVRRVLMRLAAESLLQRHLRLAGQLE